MYEEPRLYRCLYAVTIVTFFEEVELMRCHGIRKQTEIASRGVVGGLRCSTKFLERRGGEESRNNLWKNKQ